MPPLCVVQRLLVREQMLIEYVGEMIRVELCDAREAYYDSVNLGSYMFRIDAKHAVDATLRGGKARFVNHACEPNCTSRVIKVDGCKKIMIFALRDIQPDEELTYNYKVPVAMAVGE